MRRDLRTTFRRIVWMNEEPPEQWDREIGDRPIILYANHHHFFDAHFLWLVLNDRMNRPSTVWMKDWDAYPLFAAVGAQPFPPDDPRRRAATVRRTARRFRDAPRTGMVYFPEADLHAPASGIHPFPDDAAPRLGRFYPDAVWWPIAMHVTSWGDKYPTVGLSPGPLHDTPDGQERDRLVRLWHTLRETGPNAPHHTLIDGRSSPTDVWDLSRTAPFFERYLYLP